MRELCYFIIFRYTEEKKIFPIIKIFFFFPLLSLFLSPSFLLHSFIILSLFDFKRDFETQSRSYSQCLSLIARAIVTLCVNVNVWANFCFSIDLKLYLVYIWYMFKCIEWELKSQDGDTRKKKRESFCICIKLWKSKRP